MQVDKQHYWIKLLLPILIYLSFATPEGKNLMLVMVVVLNTLLFQGVYHNSNWLKWPIVLGILFEILSSNVIGMFVIKYLVISYTIIFCKENFKSMNPVIIFIMATFAFGCAISLELIVKAFLDFQLNHKWYKIAGVFTVISILITSCFSKISVYRHLK